MNVRLGSIATTLLCATWVAAAPPTDPNAKKIYDHDYEWLSHNPAAFIAINIRGENDQQYPERRQAALDLLRKRKDLTVVSDLTDELKRASFLSGDICETLGEWQAKKAIPVLQAVARDGDRTEEVRQKAKKALSEINKQVAEAPRPAY